MADRNADRGRNEHKGENRNELVQLQRDEPPSPRNQVIDAARIKGRVNTDKAALMAARVRLSARSPLNKWLRMLAIVPPGVAAISISPTARCGSRWKTSAINTQDG